MNEKLFSLFLFVMGDIIHKIGVVCYELAGGGAQKLAFHQSQVATDFSVPHFVMMRQKWVSHCAMPTVRHSREGQKDWEVNQEEEL